MNKPILCDILVNRFDEDELRELFEIDLGEDYASLPGVGKRAKALEMIAYLERRERLDALIEAGKKQRSDVRWDDCLVEQPSEREKVTSKPSSVPFTNREDEIDLIISSYAPAYHLLDAPAGYGKTELLKTLKQRFDEQGWICAYASVGERDSLADLVVTLAKEFGLNAGSIPADDVNLPFGLWMGASLRQQRESILNKGLVMLIDLEKRPSLLLVGKILEEFIPHIQESVRELEFFADRHNRFRVILAGRYLAGRREIENSPLRINVRQLSPFDYNVIWNSTRGYLADHAIENINHIAAHLLYLTGGHPGCIAQILKKYRQESLPLKHFVKRFDKDVWDDIVHVVVKDIHLGIPKTPRELGAILDRLSIFRYLDPFILRRMIEEGEIQHSDEYVLADELTSTYLLNRKGRLLRDDITRRLLAIRLWREEAKKFAAHCQQARNMCAEHLDVPDLYEPELWIIEFLFQSLQQYASTIQDPKQRQRIRQEFLEQDVPEILQRFVEARKLSPRNIPWEQDALGQKLAQDWEFRFTVNYYLRQDQYDEEPYNELRQKINDFFAQK